MPRGRRISVYGRNVVTPDGVLSDGLVVSGEGGLIDLIADGSVAHADVRGEWVLPGFIDTHIHGGGGYSVGTQDELRGLATFLPGTGTTSFLPTLPTSAPDATLDFLKAVRALVEDNGYVGAEILGSHLEGPYISVERKGAQNQRQIRPPSVAEVGEWLETADGTLRRVALAPELPGSDSVMDLLLEHGVGVAIGHSNASFDEALNAVRCGVNSVTHTFNAMPPFLHRSPGVVGVALTEPDVIAELISDGVHVHPAAVQMLCRARSPLGVAVITDAVAPMGLPEGPYVWDGRDVISDGRSVRAAAGGGLSGSATSMLGALRNLVRWGFSIVDAVQMLSTTPARLAGVGDRKGRLAAGLDADMVVLDESLEPIAVVCRGALARGEAGREPGGMISL